MSKKFNIALGHRVKVLRRVALLSQQDLGVYLELHQTAVCRVERGSQMFTPYQLYRLSVLLGVSIDDLFKKLI